VPKGAGLGEGTYGTPGQALLAAWTNKPGSSEVVLVNGDVVTGYQLGVGDKQPDWGNAIWESFYSGNRGTQGARAAGADIGNRQVVLPLGCFAATTDAMHALMSTLWGLDEDFRRFGGQITWRPKGATYRQFFDVLSCAGIVPDWDWQYHNNHSAIVTLAPVCAPYLRGDPYDIFDGFDTDTSGSYTKDADGAAFTVKGGQLVPGTTGTSRWRHSARGYAYGDVEATLKLTTGSTVTNLSVDLFINADTAGAETFFSAQLQGGNLNIAKWAAGVNTWPATVAATLTTSTTYWLRIRREGRILTANLYTSEPTPLATPSKTVSYTMDQTENRLYIAGHSGVRIAVVSTAERYDDFRVEPFTYTSAVSFA
jgi:hypothetical protein